MPIPSNYNTDSPNRNEKWEEELSKNPELKHFDAVCKLADWIWSAEKEDWHPEHLWNDLLNLPCNGDPVLIAEVCQHARNCMLSGEISFEELLSEIRRRS